MTKAYLGFPFGCASDPTLVALAIEGMPADAQIDFIKPRWQKLVMTVTA